MRLAVPLNSTITMYRSSTIYIVVCMCMHVVIKFVIHITLLNRKHIVNHTFRYSLAAIIIPRRVWLLLTHQFCKDHDQSFKMKPVKEIEALLKNIDLNGDGFLTPVEFRASIMENFGEDYEPDSDDEDFFELLGSFADDDDRVKIKKVTDFLKIMKSLENCESKKDTLKVVKKLFKFFDENGDGKLSKAEAKAGFGRMDAWKGEMEDVFEELKDDKGEVSIKDLMKHMKEEISEDENSD